jgi:hypothetical protein
MSEMRELIDTELDVVCGGQHGHHGRAELPDPALGQNFTPYGPYGHRGHQDFAPYGHGHHGPHGGDFDFGNIGDFNFGNINNSGNIVIEENITLQVGVAQNGGGDQGNLGHFDFGNIGNFNFGNINNSGNIVIEENIALQVGVAVGSNASVTNLLGAQLNSSAISRLS